MSQNRLFYWEISRVRGELREGRKLIIIEVRYYLSSKLAPFRVNGGAINNYIGTRGITWTLAGKLQSTLQLGDGTWGTL